MNSDISEPSGALGNFLDRQQRAAGKSDDEMTEALGFSSAKVYRLILSGKMKLPLSKIPMAARALGVHEAQVLRALVEDYCGQDMAPAIDKVWGTMKLTDNERNLVEAYRDLAAGQEVELKVMGATHLVALVTT